MSAWRGLARWLGRTTSEDAATGALIIHAGDPWRLTAAELRGTQAILAALAALTAGAAVAATGGPWWLVPLATLVGWSVPLGVYRTARRQRVAAVTAQLPQAVDLIQIAIGAGKTLAESLRITADYLPAGLLRDQLTTVVYDIDSGMSTSAALAGFAGRIPAPDVRVFAASVAQGERHGVDETGTLAILAGTVRRSTSARLARNAALLDSWMYLPIVAFLSAISILIIAPWTR